MTTERFDDADVQEGSGFATIADGVAATLRSEILTGELLPAQRLRFEDMRAKYRVGVGTLREALLLLSGDSLVQSFASAPCTIVAREGQNMATSAERMRALRERQRRGLRRLTIEVSEDISARLRNAATKAP